MKLTMGEKLRILLQRKNVTAIEFNGVILSMNGFNISKDDDAVEVFENKAGIFRLLVQDDKMEVFESNINQGKSIICQPYESKDSINIMIIIEGKMFHTNERTYVGAGDRITFKNLKETHHLSVLENTKLLMIRNSKHFNKQASTTDVIYRLIHQIQEKDLYTEDHCNNTGNLAVQIATIMKLPEKTIGNILYAGKIHDVGKLNISEELLNKPSKLSYEEYEIVKHHSKDGHDIIMNVTGNNNFAKIVLDHHERLDGSGYPNGLIGNEISIEARILAVIDSFDAMTSNRPYKNTLTITSAIEDLRLHCGTWYDESVVSALCEILSYTTNNDYQK